MTEKNILITGGAGFIGSHLTRLFVNKYPQYKIVNLDKLTYAGNLENLKDIEDKPNYTFVKGDITDIDFINHLFEENKFTSVLHCAAESHVDRSISDPLAFVKTNVLGTTTLLQNAKEFWKEDFSNKLFYHISTDEVYGSLGEEGFFTEETPYDPRSPYSASKASSDHFVRAFYHTYKLPIKISNCSNNYGPYHFPEKLIPLCINNILLKKTLPIYGKGENVRDWLFVEDHVKATVAPPAAVTVVAARHPERVGRSGLGRRETANPAGAGFWFRALHRTRADDPFLTIVDESGRRVRQVPNGPKNADVVDATQQGGTRRAPPQTPQRRGTTTWTRNARSGRRAGRFAS